MEKRQRKIIHLWTINEKSMKNKVVKEYICKSNGGKERRKREPSHHKTSKKLINTKTRHGCNMMKPRSQLLLCSLWRWKSAFYPSHLYPKENCKALPTQCKCSQGEAHARKQHMPPCGRKAQKAGISTGCKEMTTHAGVMMSCARQIHGTDSTQPPPPPWMSGQGKGGKPPNRPYININQA